MLRAYARRCPPAEAAKESGLSLNTLYLQYDRIRNRLIEAGYYQDAALSLNEPGLSPLVQQHLRSRRGIRDEDIHAHAAEAIEWAEEWPPRLVLRHLRRIIALTGPLDRPFELSEAEADRLHAYVRYARTELIHDRRASVEAPDEGQSVSIDRSSAALEAAWRAYRAASKRAERADR